MFLLVLLASIVKASHVGTISSVIFMSEIRIDEEVRSIV